MLSAIGQVLSTHEPDLMTHGVFEYHIGGMSFWITESIVCMYIVTIMLLIFAAVVGRSLRKAAAGEAPGGIQNAAECAFEMVNGLAESILNVDAPRFINYIATIFLFILACNLSGLLGLKAPTSDYGVTFPLGIFTFLIVNFQGIKNHGAGHFTSLLEPIPVLLPINIIGEFANPISISLRLFANIMSGIIIMSMWYAMVPAFLCIAIPACLHVYCDLFSGVIQTLVFCMLTMIFIKDKL